jgi:imidazolonepropionase-like amidohydrolase
MKTIALVLSLVASVFATALPVTAPPRTAVAFTNVTVIDGSGAAPMEGKTVLIADGRIAAIGPSQNVSVPAGARHIDATGKYLVPGLWDMHVHVLWDPAVDTLLPLMIANGVTGARDMHTHFPMDQVKGWIGEVAEGKRIGPRIIFAGPIVDGPRPFWPGSIAVGDAETGRRAVRDLKAKGSQFIKVYERLPREAYFAIADEAKKQEIPFVGHVPQAVTPLEASNAGQRSIEHLSHLLEACASAESKPGAPIYDESKGRALFNDFRRNNTWQCPTLITAETTTFGREDRIAKDPRRKYFLPSILSRVGFDDSKRDWDATLRFWREERKLMRHLHEAGVALLAGTDAPVVRNVPGFSLHDELKSLVDAGLTPMEALQAATRNPARFFEREADWGTVAGGKAADLVLLGANPLTDIRNTTQIEAVVADGRFYDRAQLDAILAAVEAAARAEGEHKAQ